MKVEIDEDFLAQSKYAACDLVQCFHDLMGLFVSMRLILDEAEKKERLSPRTQELVPVAKARMDDILARFQGHYRWLTRKSMQKDMANQMDSQSTQDE